VTSAVETLKPIHSLDVSFFVASVGLLILSEDATLQAGTPDRRQKLMDVAIENIAAKVSQFSNSELQVEVQIKSIGAHDKRALASNYYRDILDSGQFAMQFSQGIFFSFLFCWYQTRACSRKWSTAHQREHQRFHGHGCHRAPPQCG